MRMRKWLVVLMVIVCVLSISSCKPVGEENDTIPPVSENTPAEEDLSEGPLNDSGTTLFMMRGPDGGWVSYQSLIGSDTLSYYSDAAFSEIVKDLEDEYKISSIEAHQMLSDSATVYLRIDEKSQKKLEKLALDETKWPDETAGPESMKRQAAVIEIGFDGTVKGIVGGIGKKEQSLTMNRATEMARSPGYLISALAVFAPAIDAGIVSEDTQLPNEPMVMENGTMWPRNSDNRYGDGEMVTVKDAFKQSLNTVAVSVMEQLTPEKSIQFLKEKLGFSYVKSASENGLAVFGEPVHHIGVIAGDAAFVPLSMADEHTVLCGIKVVLPAKIGT